MEYAAHIVSRLRVVGPVGQYTIVVSDTKPTQNYGFWLKNGKKPYVWDSTLSDYIPADVSDSITGVTNQIAALTAALGRGKLIFSPENAPPAEVDRLNSVWIPTRNGVPLGQYVWDGTRWSRAPVQGNTSFDMSGNGVEYQGDAGDPDITSEDDLVGRLFVARVNVVSTAEVSFRYGTFSPHPLNHPDGSRVKAGQLSASMLCVIRFDGTTWTVLSPVRLAVPTLSAAQRRESVELAVPAAGAARVFAHEFPSPPTDYGAYLVAKAIVGDWPIGTRLPVAYVTTGGNQEERPAFQVVADGTNVTVQHASNENSSSQRNILSKDSGVLTDIGGAGLDNWRIVIWAERREYVQP